MPTLRSDRFLACVPLGCVLVCAAALAGFGTSAWAQAPANENPDAPRIRKVEPPDWWVNLTPDLMVLLTGTHLEATRIRCNLEDVIVSRTQSSGDGRYLFVWLKFGPQLKSGTAVCRVTTAKGQTSFELPLAARKQILGRNQGLSPDDVLYLLLPDRFANGDPTNDEPPEFPGSHDRANSRAYHGGDLRGVSDRLPYLKDLGVTTVWLTPVVRNGTAADDHGYSAVDLYGIDPHLGSLSEYQQLVESAHKLRMKVLFDVVPNHVGPLHPWVRNPPMPDWFHGSPGQHLDSDSPVKGSFYGQSPRAGMSSDALEAIEDPHATPQMRRNLTDGGLFGILPDLNTENPVVADYLVQNSIWWAETSGLDGYCIDTLPYVPRRFWEQWHAGLRKLYPRLSTIGEVVHPDPAVTSFFAGGRPGWDGVDTQLTTVLDFPLYAAIREVLLRGAPVGKIPDVLRQDSLYPHPEYLVPFFANQHTTRFAAMPGATPARMKLAMGLVLTLRGIPELYYGDEIAMPGGVDPDNRGDFPGGWQEDRGNAFSAAGRTAPQQDVFQFVRSLLGLRREHAALRGGRLWHLAADDTSYVFLRDSDQERLVVAFNNDAREKAIKLSLGSTPADGVASAMLLFGDGRVTLSGRELDLVLPAQSISIFELR